MVSDRDRELIRKRFATEPDPEQLELLSDETLDAMRDHRVSQSADRRQSMRKTRAHE